MTPMLRFKWKVISSTTHGKTTVTMQLDPSATLLDQICQSSILLVEPELFTVLRLTLALEEAVFIPLH